MSLIYATLGITFNIILGTRRIQIGMWQWWALNGIVIVVMIAGNSR
jgi:hypothetical protein